MKNFFIKLIYGVSAGIAVYFILTAASISSASIIDDLKSKIDSQKNGIEEIQKEIDKYQGEIDKTRKEANTLKSQIRRLDANSGKLTSKIKLTENKIRTSGLNIEKFSAQIKEKEKDIKTKRVFLSEIIRSINEADQVTLVEILLSGDNFSDFFGGVSRLNDFQDEIRVNLEELKEFGKDLNQKKSSEESEKINSESLKAELVDQRKLVDINKAQKNKLLNDTKNKESNYRKILAKKEKLREEFEKELRDFESQLRIKIDPASLPPAGLGILSWPLDNIFITQKFGRTVAARKLYVSGSHNGVDFRASIGTRVLSIGDGIVLGVGDTDKTCRGASFGKWILIDHENGLAATYAHLSLIKVTAGQRVERGSVIGYTGNSGYTTGPHLHLSVYARAGVSVKTRPSKVCGGRIYTMPIAPINAYLDPLDYLGH